MKKKLLWIILLIIIGFIVILSFYNITMFRINNREIYNKENLKINISKAPIFWGETIWSYDFFLEKNDEINYYISTGFLSKKTKVELLDENKDLVYSKKFISNKKENVDIKLKKGHYTLNIYYYKGIFNHIVFAVNNENIIMPEE